MMLLKAVQLAEQIEGSPKNEEAAQAIAERDHQLAQEITIQQTHLWASVRPARRKVEAGVGEPPTTLCGIRAERVGERRPGLVGQPIPEP